MPIMEDLTTTDPLVSRQVEHSGMIRRRKRWKDRLFDFGFKNIASVLGMATAITTVGLTTTAYHQTIDENHAIAGHINAGEYVSAAAILDGNTTPVLNYVLEGRIVKDNAQEYQARVLRRQGMDEPDGLEINILSDSRSLTRTPSTVRHQGTEYLVSGSDGTLYLHDGKRSSMSIPISGEPESVIESETTGDIIVSTSEGDIYGLQLDHGRATMRVFYESDQEISHLLKTVDRDIETYWFLHEDGLTGINDRGYINFQPPYFSKGDHWWNDSPPTLLRGPDGDSRIAHFVRDGSVGLYNVTEHQTHFGFKFDTDAFAMASGDITGEGFDDLILFSKDKVQVLVNPTGDDENLEIMTSEYGREVPERYRIFDTDHDDVDDLVIYTETGMMTYFGTSPDRFALGSVLTVQNQGGLENITEPFGPDSPRVMLRTADTWRSAVRITPHSHDTTDLFPAQSPVELEVEFGDNRYAHLKAPPKYGYGTGSLLMARQLRTVDKDEERGVVIDGFYRGGEVLEFNGKRSLYLIAGERLIRIGEGWVR